MRGLWLATVVVVVATAPHPSAAAQDSRFPSSLTPCRVGQALSALCGRYDVFENRTARSGRRISLRVVVLPSFAPSPAPDPLFVFAGGPGQGAADIAGVFARQYARARRHRDLVLVDQRGTGESAPLSCDQDPAPAPDISFGQLFPPAVIERCREHLSERADLAQYTTSVAVDDFDELRRWLGYDVINVAGGSYGTRTALVYLRQHPDRVRTVLLNGVAPVDLKAPLFYAADAQGGLDRVFDDCERDTECATAFPHVRQGFDTLLARFDDGPVRVSMASRQTGTTQTVRFHRGDFGYAVRGMLYGGLVERLPFLIHRAVTEGELRPFAEYYAQRSAWVRGPVTGVHLGVFCAEDVPFITPAEVEAATRGTFLGDYLYRQYRQACEPWVRAPIPPDYHEPVSVDVPVLILSGRRDPVTPPHWGERTARHLPRARHVIAPYAGHGVGGPCVAEMIARFLDEASTDRLEVGCLDTGSPPRFFVEREDAARP